MSDKLSDQWQTPGWLFDEISREHGPFDIDLCATKENSKCEFYGLDYLNDEFGREGRYCPRYLIKSFESAFMNPPYSNPKPFIKKAWEDSEYCKIVCLVKCDPSTKWWAVFFEYDTECRYCQGHGDKAVMNSFSTIRMKCPFCVNGRYSGPKPGCNVQFFSKRIAFDPPQQLIDSGDVIRNRGKWIRKCECYETNKTCLKCNSALWLPLSGPTFSSVLIIMDRRNV